MSPHPRCRDHKDCRLRLSALAPLRDMPETHLLGQRWITHDAPISRGSSLPRRGARCPRIRRLTYPTRLAVCGKKRRGRSACLARPKRWQATALQKSAWVFVAALWCLPSSSLPLDPTRLLVCGQKRRGHAACLARPKRWQATALQKSAWVFAAALWCSPSPDSPLDPTLLYGPLNVRCRRRRCSRRRRREWQSRWPSSPPALYRRGL